MQTTNDSDARMLNFSPITSSLVYTKESSLELTTKGYSPLRFLKNTLSSLLNNLANPNDWGIQADTAMNDFAKINGFTYQTTGAHLQMAGNSLDIGKLVLPNPDWKIGIIKNLVGRHRGLDFKYYTGINWGDEGGMVTCLQIKLPLQIPKLYIGLQQNVSPETGKVLGNMKPYDERVLEGDFSIYYKVFVLDNDRMTAHYILSPEVMRLLLINKMFDIWIDSGTLSILTVIPTPQPFIENITDFFSFADVLLSNVDVISKEMKNQQ